MLTMVSAVIKSSAFCMQTPLKNKTKQNTKTTQTLRLLDETEDPETFGGRDRKIQTKCIFEDIAYHGFTNYNFLFLNYGSKRQSKTKVVTGEDQHDCCGGSGGGNSGVSVKCGCEKSQYACRMFQASVEEMMDVCASTKAFGELSLGRERLRLLWS